MSTKSKKKAAQITQTPQEDNVKSPQKAPKPVASPEPTPDVPNAAGTIVDAPKADSKPLVEWGPLYVQPPTVPMPSVTQKTKAPSKGQARRAAQRQAINKAKKEVKEAAVKKPSANGNVGKKPVKVKNKKAKIPAESVPWTEIAAEPPVDATGPTALKPKIRSRKLAKVVAPATFGVSPPDGTGVDQVLEWAEKLRDDFEADGKLLTLTGLVTLARSALGDDAGPVVKELKKLYAEDSNGQTTNEVKGRKRAHDRQRETIFTDAKVKANHHDIPVEAKKSAGGKVFAKIFDLPYKSVIRWMGQDGWSYTDAVEVLKKLDLWKFCENTATDHVRNNLASGKHGNNGWVGPVPELSNEQKKALRAVKPKA